MKNIFILVLLFFIAIVLLNNKILNRNLSYLLAGIVSFFFVITLIYVVMGEIMMYFLNI